MNLTDWHRRYAQQATWTEGLRRSLFGRLELDPGSRILEVGCGTGAVMAGSHASAPGTFYGLDLNYPALNLARRTDPRARFLAGDGRVLPFASSQFDAVYCHFLLLWVAQPERALSEMARVTRAGGSVLAFAEPDYAGRIDFPPALEELGRQQAAAIHAQGADPRMGRKLTGLFHATGLQVMETGVLGGRWQSRPSSDAWASEWATLRSDLEEAMPVEELSRYQQMDESAWERGERVLFVPTFYAWGMKM